MKARKRSKMHMKHKSREVTKTHPRKEKSLNTFNRMETGQSDQTREQEGRGSLNQGEGESQNTQLTELAQHPIHEEG